MRRFTMPPEEILLVNPNTGTTPVFRSRRDAEITIGIYRQVPVLWREEPEENLWGLSFQLMFMMNSDSSLFRAANNWHMMVGPVTVMSSSETASRMLPLYEAKMIQHFDHRLGTYGGQTQAQANMGTLPRLTLEQQDDPACVVLPRYWVDKIEVDKRLARRDWKKNWLLGWRDIARSSDERTIDLQRIATSGSWTHVPNHAHHFATTWLAYMLTFASFALDYVVASKDSRNRT